MRKKEKKCLPPREVASSKNSLDFLTIYDWSPNLLLLKSCNFELVFLTNYADKKCKRDSYTEI